MSGNDSKFNHYEGSDLIAGSPFRSVYFLLPTAASIVSLALICYLIYRHRQGLGLDAIVYLGYFVTVPLIWQYWNALRCYSRIRKICSISTSEDIEVRSQLAIALGIAAREITDAMFWSYAMLISALLYISILLTHLDGLK